MPMRAISRPYLSRLSGVPCPPRKMRFLSILTKANPLPWKRYLGIRPFAERTTERTIFPVGRAPEQGGWPETDNYVRLPLSFRPHFRPPEGILSLGFGET